MGLTRPVKWWRILAAIVLACAGTYPGGVLLPVHATHSYATLSVRSANTYRHVLEDGDALVLVQYAMRETYDEETESPYGVSGAVLTVSLGDTVLKQQTPPLAGYALSAFYWDAATASELPWGDSTATASIVDNPMLFESPPSRTPTALTWNATADRDATAAELVDDLKEVMGSLEQDDPDVAARTYLSSYGITLTGQSIVEAAFPQLVEIAPDAFEIGRQPVGEELVFESLTPGGAAAPQVTETFDGAVEANATSSSVTLASTHFYSDTTGMTVTRSGGYGDVTASCALGGDRVTLACSGLAADPSATDLTVVYYTSTAGAQSEFTEGMSAMGEAFGVPWNATRLILLLVVAGVLGVLVKKTGGEPHVLLIFAGPVLFWAGQVGALPFEAVLAILALVVVAGSAPVFSRMFG